MTTKNISITEEAYKRLSSLRKTNESFSEIIEKITGRVKLRDFYGILSREAGEQLEKSINESRKRHNKMHSERIKRIAGELSK